MRLSYGPKEKKMFHPNVKRYIQAIKLYNESIAFSEKGSTERALAYVNRSNICLKMQRFEECLENIRLARESNYPGEKLIQREKEVKNALAKARNKNASSSKASPDVVEEPELSYAAKENAPQVANCLELRKNEEYGRHVVTTRKLKVGDVVMIERPFVTVLKDSFRYVRCDFCHEERPFTLIPCEGCTMAMYCSEECLSKAYNNYHRYECGLLRDLWEVFEAVPLIAIRMIAIAIATFDNNPEALKDHLDALDESNVNGFTMDWNKATQQDIFNTVHVLTTNQERRDSFFVAFYIFNATILHTLVLERTELEPVCEANPATNKFLLDLILRYMQIVDCNRK
ncbi:AGAP011270-PA [Anopheles gambiae str. PEST]|uniref:AGAP011270-PA n=1 Tax=Anopheles gambiae TaxID=7165 RepID=Q7QHN4_ANOGA|nr:AGAP011270-PA [Anopheles gambiae str. PEST]